MNVFVVACYLAGLAAFAAPELLWRRTRAAAVLREYPWRARVAARRARNAQGDVALPMALLKATKVRMDFERRFRLRGLAGLLLVLPADLEIAKGAAVVSGAPSWWALFLVEGAAAAAGVAVGSTIVGRRRARLEQAIAFRERGF